MSTDPTPTPDQPGGDAYARALDRLAQQYDLSPEEAEDLAGSAPAAFAAGDEPAADTPPSPPTPTGIRPPATPGHKLDPTVIEKVSALFKATGRDPNRPGKI